MHAHTHVVDGITKSSEPVQIRGGKKKKEEGCHPRKVCVCVHWSKKCWGAFLIHSRQRTRSLLSKLSSSLSVPHLPFSFK